MNIQIETLSAVAETDPASRIRNRYGTMELVRTNDQRLFSAKANHPYARGAIPLAHEVFFHVFARANRVRVAASAFLMVNGAKHWGAEYPLRESTKVWTLSGSVIEESNVLLEKEA